jgi:N-methylhydantoinase A
LNPDSINSGDGVDPAAQVRNIFTETLGKPLGIDALGAAAAVIRVANTVMAGAIRMVSVSLGVDPRDFCLFAFGGAGPLHATALARKLAVPTVLLPCRPGITNALGCIVAELRHDFVNTLNTPLDQLDTKRLHGVFAAQMAEGEALVNKQKVAVRSIKYLFSVDMQFVGQTHLLRVALQTPVPDLATLRELFEKAYYSRFQLELSDIRANLVNVNTSVVGERPDMDLSTLIDPAGRLATPGEAQSGKRQVYFDNRWVETPVYWRDHLPLTFSLPGPAIIEQMDTTTLIEPADTAEGDSHGNILIHIGAQQ